MGKIVTTTRSKLTVSTLQFHHHPEKPLPTAVGKEAVKMHVEVTYLEKVILPELLWLFFYFASETPSQSKIKPKSPLNSALPIYSHPAYGFAIHTSFLVLIVILVLIYCCKGLGQILVSHSLEHQALSPHLTQSIG